MSGLEKFNATEAWFGQLRNRLKVERPPKHIDNSEPAPTEESTSRHSLYYSEDLKTILEAKALPKVPKTTMENKENIHNYPVNEDKRKISKVFDMTLNEVNDSFENMEKMCDKTVSDPNSTLFSYMQSFNQSKDQCDGRSITSLLRDIDNVIGEDSVADQTQLNEIEAPSCFWEKTFSDTDNLQTSPVKLVGLMRPSTILEESSSYCESENSATSFQTADKTVETTSSCFETANETLNSHKSNPHVGMTKFKKPGILDRFTTSKSSNDSESISRSTLEDVSSLLEDSLHVTPEERAMKEERLSKTVFIEDESIIEITDESYMQNNSTYSLNEGFSIAVSDTEDANADQSVNFDDTLEDIASILRQGQMYLQESSLKPPACNVPFQSPLTAPCTPSNAHNSQTKYKPPTSSNTKIGSSSKPFTDTFKKPTSKIPQPKSLSATKKQSNFSHIVSPIGAYIKNTPKTPSFVNTKTGGDIFKSKAMKELEFGSNKKYPIAKTNFNTPSSSLPKKAYISAEYKHITDQRTPVTIPGGEKIHKYLQSSMVPAVIRHEGKMKMSNYRTPSDFRDTGTTDDTLADLSVMSGDVSVYTIKDAKKY